MSSGQGSGKGLSGGAVGVGWAGGGWLAGGHNDGGWSAREQASLEWAPRPGQPCLLPPLGLQAPEVTLLSLWPFALVVIPSPLFASSLSPLRSFLPSCPAWGCNESRRWVETAGLAPGLAAQERPGSARGVCGARGRPGLPA